MPKIQEKLIGKVFSHLTIIEDLGVNKAVRYVKVKCQCGNEKSVCLNSIKRGLTKSCGCLKKLQSKENLPLGVHGLSRTDLYYVYAGMKKRCYNPSSKNYKDYGGRGITICDEWNEDFLSFYNWAIANGYKKGLFIDRKENSKGYSPDNCRFVTRIVNNRNKRGNVILEFNGQRKTAIEWAEETGIAAHNIWNRIRCLNWPVERALTTP